VGSWGRGEGCAEFDWGGEWEREKKKKKKGSCDGNLHDGGRLVRFAILTVIREVGFPSFPPLDFFFFFLSFFLAGIYSTDIPPRHNHISVRLGYVE